MKGFGFLILLLLIVNTCFAAEKNLQPNIIYIMSDDQGWKDIGYHGSDIKTPNLDQLANTGVKLDQYYAQSMCTQSRAALMTGRYPFRYGLQTIVIPSAGRYGLPTDEWLLPQALKKAGYNTAIIGKWHLGHADKKFWPRQRGFDYQYGPLLGEIDYFTHSAHGTRDWFLNNQPIKETGYVTDLLGNDAVNYIERQSAQKPFFLYLTFTGPHAPYQAPEKYLQQYPDIKDNYRKTYAAMITAIDDQVGRVVDVLDKKGLRDNTLIVYQSDNGGPLSAAVTGEVDMSGGKIPANNGSYRDGKGSLYEGGNRVIAFANWPGHLSPGAFEQPMHMVDMYPTLVKLTGGSLTDSKPLDGVDRWPAITEGKVNANTEIVYNVEPNRCAIREGQWKLVWVPTLPSSIELFDLAADPNEKNNLAASNLQTVTQLQKRCETLAQQAKPPMLMHEVMGVTRSVLFGSVLFPEDNSEAAKAMESVP